MINGRSMPDDMDTNYAVQYPHQPYNGNPHMHPGELVLLRIIGQGRWQHPFHEHGNHVRVLARDGHVILNATDPTKPAGPLLFTTTTTPGQAIDGIFYWTGKGLNWDVYGHNAANDPGCTADANGYNTGNAAAPNYYEWCQDHLKRWRKRPSVMWELVDRSPFPIRRFSPMGRGMAAVLTWGQTLRAERSRPRPFLLPGLLATTLDRKPASPSCGTRTTSARSPPTIFFPAE